MINSIPADPLRIFFIALISVHIASSEEGVVADGFEFIVEHLPSDSQNTRSSVQESPGKKAIHHERSTGLKENQPFPIQKKAPSVKKNKLLVFDNKTDSLIYRLVDQRPQKASQKVQKLIEEQKLLISKNEEPLKEIKELRLKLEELNLKNKQSSNKKIRIIIWNCKIIRKSFF